MGAVVTVRLMLAVFVRLPDVPVIGEFVPGYDGSGWIGIGAPKATPVEIVEKLNKEINAGLNTPKFAALLVHDHQISIRFCTDCPFAGK